ncbi:MAG: response regulator transcription factor [Oribacterium sp.]|nr:response regulator transcription factor [Oribacterium sp.]
MVIGICDDEKSIRDTIDRSVRNIDEHSTIKHFKNGEEVLGYYRQGGSLDVLYLDIDLNCSMDGMEVAEKLKRKYIEEGRGASETPFIIFITGLPERMPEAFGVRAFQFIVKPIEEKHFMFVFEQVRKAVLQTLEKSKPRYLTVNSCGITRPINLSDIVYIESIGRKLIIHLANTVFEIYGKLDDVKSKLDKNFILVHRSFIVNMRYISDYTRKDIRIITGDLIPLSKYKYKYFVDGYVAFLESEIC